MGCLPNLVHLQAHIVPSVSGTHEGNERYKVGHTRLCSVIEQLGLQQKQVADGPKVELQVIRVTM
jgi:hypothetical protein